jgi:UDP-2,4-diacetamido-2,4,6-trideoxy-beta-L-altropyranose hydrolase
MVGRPVWLVVDHYDIDIAWETELRGNVGRLFVIDDLANRRHECDMLLDQNYYNNPDERYKGRVPDHCRLLLGPGYALLSPEFEKAAMMMRPRDGRIKRVLIFFGGSDPTGETEKSLDAIELFGTANVHFDVVVGISNPKREALRARCEGLKNVHFYCQTSEMAALCVNADLALGAGGSANWERFSVGLPCIVVTTADNQKETVAALSDGGYIRSLGWRAQVGPRHMAEALDRAMHELDDIHAMGRRARSLMEKMDFQGACAVADTLLFGTKG